MANPEDQGQEDFWSLALLYCNIKRFQFSTINYKHVKKQVIAHSLKKITNNRNCSEEAQMLDLPNKIPKSALLKMFKELKQIILVLNTKVKQENNVSAKEII